MKIRYSDNNRVILTIALYILSAIMICGYFYLDSSDEIRQFVKKADNHRTDWGFFFHTTIGLVQFGLLTAGVAIFAIITFMNIKRKS